MSDPATDRLAIGAARRTADAADALSGLPEADLTRIRQCEKNVGYRFRGIL